MAAPIFSVVVPAYNARASIADALASARAQAVDLELVVVDDGSTDGTAELVESEFPEARVVRQANAGPAAARNRGIAEARGEYVAFLDADDVWLPGKLARQAEVLASRPAASLVYAGWARPSAEGPPPGGVRELHFLQVLAGYFIGPSGVVAPRRLLEDVGGFRGERNGIEDRDLWSRLAMRGPVLMVEEVLWLYRDSPGSFTKRRMRGFKAGLALMDEMRPEVARRYGDEAWQTLLAHQLFRYRFYFRRDGDREGVRLCDERLRTLQPAARARAYGRLFLPYLWRRVVQKARRTDGYWGEPIVPLGALGVRAGRR